MYLFSPSAIPASGIPDVLGYSGASGLGTQGTGWTVSKTYNGTLPSTYPVNGTILSNVNGMLIQVRAE
ncbi:MAG: hypothetical protein KGL95_11380 [Patescibacteria group bacterium]|nr:hypothetical protein [Nitrososphaerota archaeon]MDE2590248.1 hypothetical protein [Patescibacteria group bacterium]